METYCYNFSRVVNGQVETKHIYAASLVDAKRDYFATFGVNPDSPGFQITRDNG